MFYLVKLNNTFFNFFICWLLIIPFLVFKGGYEGPKVVWFLGGVIILTIFWIWRILGLKENLKFLKSDFFFILWLLLLFVSSLLGIHPLESILGGSYRHQGVLFFLGLWIVKKTLEILPEEKKTFLKKGIAVSVILEVFIVISQVLLGKTYFARPLGTLGEPNAVAGFLAVGSFFVSFWFWPFLAIFLTGSRTGIVAFTVFLLSRFRRLPLGVILLVVFAAVFIFFKGGELRPKSKFEDRSLFWQMAVGFIQEKPILGWGAESQEYLYNREFARKEMPLEGMIVDRSHNLFLDVAIWSGTLGLLAFAGWLISLSFELKKNVRMLFGFLAWIVFSLFQPLGVTHWVLLILIYSL